MACVFKILGYDHIKVALADVSAFEVFLRNFGFSRVTDLGPDFLRSPSAIWGSGDAVFCLYEAKHPEAKKHFDLHGDTVFDLSLLIESPDANQKYPFVYEGVGQMKHTLVGERSFKTLPAPRGVLKFDHNTLNIEQGHLEATVNDYLDRFGFEKGQYFDIKGKATGLYSWVTRAPNRSVQIPFNVAADNKSQIQEFIDAHRGPGVQHIAFLTKNIISTMDSVMKDKENQVRFLDIPDTYYELVRKRIKIRESYDDLERLRVLVDSDEKQNYLLQIFTQNLFGGFFIELIQREGNIGFGEGNFTALFESIELDQKRRGVL